ncbi:MAG: Mrp/NBP35 family ATP-binding protein [Paludibacter sp.]|jgi:ATP-binding protein involved in chromosome partitioning|nr:Mrp/NBP35 family ATP-binding protein [Paludibacter sp.]
MNIYPNQIIEVLRNVRYPGTGKDIVSMGMLADDIRIEGQKVSFSIIFDKQRDPFEKSLVKAAETAILTFVGQDVDIKGNITVQHKVAAPVKTEEILPQVKNIIAVFSGKGGVGKSTVAANLAISLAALGYKTGLLDADIYGPSQPKMFGVENEHPTGVEINGKTLINPLEKYGVKMLSIGFFTDSKNALVWRGAMASNAVKQLITEGNWGELDYFIIDLPPGTGDIQLTLVQTLGLTGAIVVTTPQQVALADAIRGINMFRNEKINVPILGLVENMAWFTPAELPDKRYYIFGKEGGKLLAQTENIPLLAQIPLVQSICENSDTGQPSACNSQSISGMVFLELAKKIIDGKKT